MLHVVLYQPEIAPNTGNVGRLCAFAGCRLHLIHPLGFTISDRHLRRAGMDYWHRLDVHEHASWDAFLGSPAAPAPSRIWLLSARAERVLWDARFCDGDGLLLGREADGVPEALHAWADGRRLCIPRGPGLDELRSLNQATSAGIAVYEALRQLRVSRAPPG